MLWRHFSLKLFTAQWRWVHVQGLFSCADATVPLCNTKTLTELLHTTAPTNTSLKQRAVHQIIKKNNTFSTLLQADRQLWDWKITVYKKMCKYKESLLQIYSHTSISFLYIMRHGFMNASVSCKKVYWQAARSLRDKMFTVHFTETIIFPQLTLMKMFLLHMLGVRPHKHFTSVLQRYVIHKQKINKINAF